MSRRLRRSRCLSGCPSVSRRVRSSSPSELEPLPKVYADPIAIIAGFLGFGFIYAAVYQSVASAWSAGIISRAIRIAGVLFGSVFAFWEFFTSFDLFGESIQLIALELLFWAIIASAEDMSITVVYESNL